MFCFQCEETARGTGCTVRGVCSKDEALSGAMDVLLYLCRGSRCATSPRARPAGRGATRRGGSSPMRSLRRSPMSTSTTRRFREMIRKAVAIRDALPPMGADAPDAATWTPASDADIDAKAKEVGVLATGNEDVRSLR